jgi:hypothetical protein
MSDEASKAASTGADAEAPTTERPSTELRENFNHFSGQIVGDPFDGVDPDRKYTHPACAYVPSDPPGAHRVLNMAHYEGIVLSVHFFTDQWRRVEGSAVMVAPGVAFTAAHVFEEHLPSPTTVSEPKMACVGYTSSGLRIWRPVAIERVNGTDLLILSLELRSALPTNNEFRQAALTARLPAIGETMMVAGFRASNEHVAASNKMTFAVENGNILYGQDLLIGVGQVTQYLPTGRGSLIRAPVLEVECSTPGGLSGGPAFDKDGKVVGILSSSINYPDGGGHSAVSLLFPGLVLPIRPTFLAQNAPERIRLIELENCSIYRRDAIRWSIQEDGQTRIEYDDGTDALSGPHTLGR